MKITTAQDLQSSGYRCLFEYIEKEGIEPALALVQDLNRLPNLRILIHQVIMGKECSLFMLAEKHRDIIRYLKEHENEFLAFNFQDKNKLNILTNLYNDFNLLKPYLENARRLEELNVAQIEFVEFFDYRYYCDIYRNKDNGKIINIYKHYTDGNVTPGEEFLKDIMFSHSAIPFDLENATFLLHCQNTEDFCQYRRIQIKDFGFEGSKLPDEDEVQSYEIPQQLVRKKFN